METPSLRARTPQPAQRDSGNAFLCGAMSVRAAGQEKAHLPHPESCHYSLGGNKNLQSLSF